MLSVFFILFFSVSGPVSFAVFCRSSLLRVVFWKKFRERTFVFGWLCWSCVFWWVFAYVFASFLAVRSRNCPKKILLLSGLVFFLGSFSFPLVFSPTSFFVVFVCFFF